LQQDCRAQQTRNPDDREAYGEKKADRHRQSKSNAQNASPRERQVGSVTSTASAPWFRITTS
jgi:hypothetical protein